LVRDEAIYESWEVKRAGAESLGRELPHIPFTFGVGRSGPSQTTLAVPVLALPSISPEPEAEGEAPSAAFFLRVDADVIVTLNHLCGIIRSLERRQKT
jgi:hypothetical protein